MDNVRIVINNGDGTVDILIPAPKSRLTLDEIIEKDVPPDKGYRVVDKSKLPSDRTFRTAWTDDNDTDTVDVDIPKAREVAHSIRRRMRDAEMAPLDVKATIPMEMEAAEAARAALRSKYDKMQTDIDAADTPEKLKTILGG